VFHTEFSGTFIAMLVLYNLTAKLPSRKYHYPQCHLGSYTPVIADGTKLERKNVG
jgi:hypothetical protein